MNHADARTRLATALAGNPHADYDAAAAIAFAEEADAFAMSVFRLKYGRPGATERVDRELFDDVLCAMATLIKKEARHKRWRGWRGQMYVGIAQTILTWWLHAPDGAARDSRYLLEKFHDVKSHDRLLWAVKILDGAAARAAETFIAKLARDAKEGGL